MHWTTLGTSSLPTIGSCNSSFQMRTIHVVFLSCLYFCTPYLSTHAMPQEAHRSNPPISCPKKHTGQIHPFHAPRSTQVKSTHFMPQEAYRSNPPMSCLKKHTGQIHPFHAPRSTQVKSTHVMPQETHRWNPVSSSWMILSWFLLLQLTAWGFNLLVCNL